MSEQKKITAATVYMWLMEAVEAAPNNYVDPFAADNGGCFNVYDQQMLDNQIKFDVPKLKDCMGFCIIGWIFKEHLVPVDVLRKARGANIGDLLFSYEQWVRDELKGTPLSFTYGASSLMNFVQLKQDKGMSWLASVQEGVSDVFANYMLTPDDELAELRSAISKSELE